MRNHRRLNIAPAPPPRHPNTHTHTHTHNTHTHTINTHNTHQHTQAAEAGALRDVERLVDGDLALLMFATLSGGNTVW